jgi:HEAT repeat protein
MSSANVADAQMTTAFADGVVARGQTEETATLFRALDNTGNLAAAPALVKGLQSENTELRMLALDALSEMQSDATVVKWLKFVAENDTDARVRNEAVRVLAQGANQSP